MRDAFCMRSDSIIVQPPAMASNSTSATPQLIARLEQSKAQDEESLKDPTLSISRRGDLLDHKTRADLAIRDLEHGFPVSASRINYAVEVPPRHLSSAQKTALVQQLQNAIREDEAREQAVVAFSSNVFYEDPDAPSVFGQQEQLAQRQIEDLQEGRHVSWDDLQEALYVPANHL
jgi:hypothetical protein